MSSVAGWWGGMEAGGAVGGRELVRVYVQSVKVPQGLGRSRLWHRHWGGHSWLERAGEESQGRQGVCGVLAPLQGYFCKMLLWCGSVP